MKYLNKNFPDCKLNVKLRKIYKLKQKVNNSKMDAELKRELLRYFDKSINMCWELSRQHVKGFKNY